MKKTSILGSIIAVLMFLTSCVTVHYAPSDMVKKYQKRSAPAQVKVYRTQMPEKKFIEIGSVNVNGANSPKTVDALREKASEVGGDALIKLEAYPGGMAATVIRYKQ